MPDVFNGYQPDFLAEKAGLPVLNEKQQKDLAPVTGSAKRGIADYINYSVALSASRRFPYFTASNIDGNLFRKAPRKDRWRKDERIAGNLQWGSELYTARKSEFDKGHMTKREDVQWGVSAADASKAADSTFFYTNAVPQHLKLNRSIWRRLEDYVLHTETTGNGLKICDFTGPVLSEKDPVFVTRVNGVSVQIPSLFWKVILFPKSDGSLFRAGFLMSQASLLKNNGIVKEAFTGTAESFTAEDRLFMDFNEAETYQVNIATIEKLTGITMPPAKETYTDSRKIKLILKEIDVRESFSGGEPVFERMGFSINGIVL